MLAFITPTASAYPARSPVHTPFGGALLFPLQAAVCCPLEAPVVLSIARRLLELGAPANISWRGVDGCHTPLSKALCLGNLPLAQLLVGAGAGGRGRGRGCAPIHEPVVPLTFPMCGGSAGWAVVIASCWPACASGLAQAEEPASSAAGSWPAHMLQYPRRLPRLPRSLSGPGPPALLSTSPFRLQRGAAPHRPSGAKPL